MSRTNYFLQLIVASFLGQSLGTLIASALMEHGFAWLPILLSYVVLPVGLCTIFFFPETLQNEETAATNGDGLGNGAGNTRKRRSVRDTLAQLPSNASTQLKETFSIVSSPSAAFIVFSMILGGPVALCVGTPLIIYVSKRFDWTLGRAGYLPSIRGFTDIVVFLVLIPLVTKALMSEKLTFRLSTTQKDLTLARTSMVFLTIGTSMLAVYSIPVVIAGFIIMTCGLGWLAVCKSLLLAFTDTAHASRMYSLTGVFESIGSLVAGPLFASLFSYGMRLGHGWEALPFLAVSCLCFIGTILLFLVRLPTTTK